MLRFLKWLQMLSLRLYKKPSFLAILLIIPLCIVGFAIAAEDDSGFLHIILVTKDEEDPMTQSIISELSEDDAIIRFSVSDSANEARDAVLTGKADAAWIFPKDLENKLIEFLESSYFNGGFVEIIERGSSIPLRLSHEKLSSALFRRLSRYYYIDYMRNEVPDFDNVDDETLLRYYDEVKITEELFTVTDIDGNESVNVSYLTSPIRGLLSIVVMLGGMAAAMFCIRDEKTGTFSRIPEKDRIYVNFACILIAVINVCVAAIAAIYVGGLGTSFPKECLAMLLYALCCTVFCLFWKMILRTAKIYGSAIPLFTVVMIAACPVFFDFKALGIVKFLLPPSLYIQSVYNSVDLLYMAAYAVIMGAVCLVTDKISRLRASK